MTAATALRGPDAQAIFMELAGRLSNPDFLARIDRLLKGLERFG